MEIFAEYNKCRERMERLLNLMKSEPGKSPFDEWVIDFLELMLEYHDRTPAI